MTRPALRKLPAWAFAVCAIPLLVDAKPAEPLWDQLPALCRSLLADGWQAPSDALTGKPRDRAETSIPGLMYVCTIERALPRDGAGRRPDLSMLLTGVSEPGVIVSASVWCEPDRKPTLAALAQTVADVLARARATTPDALTSAIEAAAAYETTIGDLHIKTVPIDVDANACAGSTDAQLTPVLMKIDVTVEPR